MITDIILLMIYVFAWIPVQLIALLPDVTTNSMFATAFTNAGAYIAPFNTFLPISTIITLLTWLITYIVLPYFTFKILYWGLKRLPTQS